MKNENVVEEKVVEATEDMQAVEATEDADAKGDARKEPTKEEITQAYIELDQKYARLFKAYAQLMDLYLGNSNQGR